MAVARLLSPLQDCDTLRAMWPRVFLAALFASFAAKAGINYCHLCEAGSRLVEGGAAWGAPLLVLALILFSPRLWLGMLGSAALTIVGYVLQRPYLDWIHGN
ncbi:MAG: hypothetical protein L0Y71_10810 [Gemmataceae bacterium]|nr:hypothetical protein [Gemmataceae bacterium]